ncbi:MAG: hypothetical protein KC503_21275 [Myxococcales bacterium]|nr:hypothetical protein [Myxococcales bacterium]
MRMRRLCVVFVAAGALMLLGGCKKKKPGGGTGTGTTAAPKKGTGDAPGTTKPAAGGLPADTAYASGNTKGVAMALEMKLEVPGLDKGPKGGDDLKAAQAGSVFKQAMHVDDKRGRMVFQTKDSYIPEGTELRYDPSKKKYVLADPGKKKYWVMTGSELGNLLEGGPGMTRMNYKIEVTDGKAKETVAGIEAALSKAKLSFDWKVKAKGGEKTGKITVNLDIWHTADKKFKAEWGDMMIDFLTVPFQDADGQKVVDELKKKINFPVKWAMEVISEGGGGKSKEPAKAPKMVTTATSVEVKDLPKADLAYPPAGYAAAEGPYQFGKGGQTADKDVLGKIPAKKGKPPKDHKPPVDPDADKKGGAKKGG